eukprot:g8377.t1
MQKEGKKSQGSLSRDEEGKSAKGKDKKRMKELTHPGICKVPKPLAVRLVILAASAVFFVFIFVFLFIFTLFLSWSSAPASASASASVAATCKAIKKEIIEIDGSDEESSKVAVKKRKMKSKKESEDALEWTCKICTYVDNPPDFLVCELCSAKRNQHQLQADDSDRDDASEDNDNDWPRLFLRLPLSDSDNDNDNDNAWPNENANDDTKSNDDDSDSDSDSAAASINTAKVLGRDVAAGEELPGEETFIALSELIMTTTSNSGSREHPAGSNQYTGKYRPAWLHVEKEKQCMNDPSTAAEEFERWEKYVLASHIISLDVYMQRCDDGDESPLRIASADQEHKKVYVDTITLETSIHHCFQVFDLQRIFIIHACSLVLVFLLLMNFCRLVCFIYTYFIHCILF